ncbi:MAG TPA: hypothetical protein VMG98_10650 [Verrucomicrobiae bacterium]|nr:hypothetical protein [Verrucomicrobiae bacterium]
MKIDRAFCDAIERTEVAASRECVSNARTRFPQLHPQAHEIAGGIAAFAGINSPFSEAIGLGLWESAGRREAESLTAFYRERGAQPRVRCSPYAEPAFIRALIALGYEPLEYETPMTAELATIGARRDARVTPMRDASEWSAATGSAFMDGAPCDESNLAIGLVICTLPGVPRSRSARPMSSQLRGAWTCRGRLPAFTAPVRRRHSVAAGCKRP